MCLVSSSIFVIYNRFIRTHRGGKIYALHITCFGLPSNCCHQFLASCLPSHHWWLAPILCNLPLPLPCQFTSPCPLCLLYSLLLTLFTCPSMWVGSRKWVLFCIWSWWLFPLPILYCRYGWLHCEDDEQPLII